jgi:hypothetical protein
LSRDPSASCGARALAVSAAPDVHDAHDDAYLNAPFLINCSYKTNSGLGQDYYRILEIFYSILLVGISIQGLRLNLTGFSK